MGSLGNFVSQHYVVIIWTWIVNNVISVMITSMPSPTKNSSVGYVYCFKVLNTIVGNLARAKSTAVENSPNFQDAVDKVNKGA